MKFKIFVLSIYSIWCLGLNGQEQLGLRLENFSGINSVFINPAAPSTSPLSWDVNLVSLGFFGDNNYGYIEDASVLALYKQRDDLKFVAVQDSVPDAQIPPDAFIIDYVNNGRKRNVSSLFTLHGPSAMIKLDKHTVGLFYNYRFTFGSLNIPTNFSYYPYIAQKFYDPFYVDVFEGAMMIWDEIGLNYGYKIETNNGFLALATNIKLIGGKEGAFFENKQPLNYTKLPNDSIMSDLAVLEYGLTTASLEEGAYARKNTGRGFGVDLGVVATFGDYKDEGYDLKLSAALLDIGWVTFNKNTELHYVSSSNIVEVPAEDYDIIPMESGNYSDYLKTFSQQALGDSLASLVGNEFIIGLPTAISLQGDYSFTENLYANFTFIHGIPIRDHFIIRNSIMALTPRYENRWFSVQVPMVWYNYQNFRVGLAARIAFLTLGTDNIGSLVGKFSNFSGADFYVGLKVNPFNGKRGDRYSGPGKSLLNNKKIKCYDF